jgi:uncharacterized membrane protein HdeD (DUF308 family)
VSSLPGLVADAPPAVATGVGAIVLLLGLLVVTRPLTSLVLLTVYVGLSAVLSGVGEFLREGTDATTRRRVFGAVWILFGGAILLGLGRTLAALPDVVALMLILGGLASAFDAASRTGTSRRVLAGAWSVAQLVFGVLALSWPDVTVLVVAVVFGARTALFGLSLIVRGMNGFGPGRGGAEGWADAFAHSPLPAPAESPRTSRLRAAGRYVLAVALVGVAASAWWVSGWISQGAHVVDAFYDPPPVIPFEHGSLIRTDDFAGQHPPGADVKRILYTTRDAVGAPAVASALVIIPEERRPGTRPVVVWNHGTTGVARGCAPSLRDAAATKWSIPAVEEAIERGWVIVASDYSGQGAPGTFPYLIGRGEARSSLDAALAARQLPGVALSPRTLAWGHSQGGHAALWMSQIASAYAPAIDIRGTALLAPVTEPLALAEELDGTDADVLLTILISWVLVPYADTYPDVDLARYVTPGGATIVREMTQRCPTEPGVIVSVATGLGIAEDRPLYVRDLTSGPLGERLAANAPTGPWEEPVLVTWGDADEVIPPRLQQRFVDQLCADGVQTRWVVFGGYDHLATLLPSSRFHPLLVRWSEDRLLGGDGPVDDCGR